MGCRGHTRTIALHALLASFLLAAFGCGRRAGSIRAPEPARGHSEAQAAPERPDFNTLISSLLPPPGTPRGAIEKVYGTHDRVIPRDGKTTEHHVYYTIPKLGLHVKYDKSGRALWAYFNHHRAKYHHLSHAVRNDEEHYYHGPPGHTLFGQVSVRGPPTDEQTEYDLTVQEHDLRTLAARIGPIPWQRVRSKVQNPDTANQRVQSAAASESDDRGGVE